MRFQAFAVLPMFIGLVAAAPNPVVRGIFIDGDTVIPVPALAAHLAVKVGSPYSQTLLSKDAASVRAFYKARHLELASISGGIDPASLDAKTNTAVVKYAVYVARVASVRFAGSGVDPEELSRRIRLHAGSVLDTDLLKSDEQVLRAAGRFKNVHAKVERGPDPRKPQGVTLVWVLR